MPPASRSPPYRRAPILRTILPTRIEHEAHSPGCSPGADRLLGLLACIAGLVARRASSAGPWHVGRPLRRDYADHLSAATGYHLARWNPTGGARPCVWVDRGHGPGDSEYGLNRHAADSAHGGFR